MCLIVWAVAIAILYYYSLLLDTDCREVCVMALGTMNQAMSRRSVTTLLWSSIFCTGKVKQHIGHSILEFCRTAKPHPITRWYSLGVSLVFIHFKVPSAYYDMLWRCKRLLRKHGVLMFLCKVHTVWTKSHLIEIGRLHVQYIFGTRLSCFSWILCINTGTH